MIANVSHGWRLQRLANAFSSRMRWGKRLGIELGALVSVPLFAAQGTNTLAHDAAPATAASSWLRAELLGIPVWAYVAFLVYLILAFYVSKFIDHILNTQLRKLSARTATRLDDLVLDLERNSGCSCAGREVKLLISGRIAAPRSAPLPGVPP